MSHLGIAIDQSEVTGAGAVPIGKSVNDIYFSGGELVVVRDGEAVAQLVRQHLETYLGEWFLNSEVGVPWFQYIYKEPFDILTAEAVIKDAVMSVDGVEEIIEFQMEANLRERHLVVKRMAIRSVYNKQVRVI